MIILRHKYLYNPLYRGHWKSYKYLAGRGFGISLDTYIPVVDLSKCDSCGTCAEKCPSKVFKVIERAVLAG